MPFEVLRPDLPRGGFRAVLFDFDGTLSLIRRNWQNVMIPMMVDALSATATRETREELFVKVEEFVMRLNGRQTIYQMMQLADEVHARGGSPLDPLDYKRRYHDLLWEQVGKRVADLKQGRAEPDDWTVPGTRALLTALCERGLSLFLASGTDLKYVRDEAQTLRLGHFFGPHIYGALDDYKSFSKALVIRKMIDEMGVRGEELLAFGDGFVEIEEVRRAGGVAVGVASEEERRAGINDWKRRRLIRAGADVIIGDYRRLDDLLELLGLAVNS
ncbi:MAG: HAD hydrolase-like protein [Planctomycetia bacterium]|nr:HAD hydrolase-like protein [Planctomycetia bacterium]